MDWREMRDRNYQFSLRKRTRRSIGGKRNAQFRCAWDAFRNRLLVVVQLIDWLHIAYSDGNVLGCGLGWPYGGWGFKF